MKNHTPVPYRVTDRATILSETGEFIAVCGDPQTEATTTDQANAEFIAHACNSHDELIEALQRLVKAFSPDLYRTAAAAHGRASVADDAHLNAQAVLCRAVPHTGEDGCFCWTCSDKALGKTISK